MLQEVLMIKQTLLFCSFFFGVAQASDGEFGSVEIGAEAPAFSLPNLSGETVSLSELFSWVLQKNSIREFLSQAHETNKYATENELS